MTTEAFAELAVKGFSLGFALGMMLWGICYAWKVFRRAVIAALRIVE